MPFIPNPPVTPNRPPCTSSQHNHPKTVSQPPGWYTWQCPVCGETQTVWIESKWWPR